MKHTEHTLRSRQQPPNVGSSGSSSLNPRKFLRNPLCLWARGGVVYIVVHIHIDVYICIYIYISINK